MTGVFVPAGTPKAIVDLLQQEISAIVKSPDIKAAAAGARRRARGRYAGGVRQPTSRPKSPNGRG